MNHLLRSHAPISDAAWAEIDSEASERLVANLGARRLIDFAGPLGWDYSATNLGRTEKLAAAPVDGAVGARRRVLPLVEVRVPFTLSRDELLGADRGADDIDFDALDDAAVTMAMAENTAVFHGWKDAGIQGISEVSPHTPVPRVEDFNDYPKRVAKAVEVLRKTGIAGPYGLALGPDDYTSVTETAEHGGYPLFDHLRKILGGPIAWVPGVRGAAVLSVSGGDFLFESGQDIAVGYDRHDGDDVQFYLEQSFNFRAVTPEAAVVLAAE
ncbi:family 1 encapsulin nanocompartment shell protein [Spelaeicoccus albus]|uniref:Type 1 encapsulin shell protein n=1 Tax=Spelaeicoccus albus TaxID=1280376 RepID=A0A7Z0A8K0_9MICO|nr:family 1 encapsulin nanocompartment shell protein [Spelaeicoccus albus]NYI66394.1 putative linocin/CFP29 family protein [Spelaeicoccus albus]